MKEREVNGLEVTSRLRQELSYCSDGRAMLHKLNLPFFSTIFLGNLYEYHHKSHIPENYILYATFLSQTVWVYH